MMKACLKRNVPSAKNLSLSRVGKKGNALVYIEHYDAVLIYELAMEIRSPVVGVALIITWTQVFSLFLTSFDCIDCSILLFSGLDTCILCGGQVMDH